ncbi:energy-coupling factor transporter transmembrane component T family protein [Dolichospermum circinale]|uniref:energy-coupling factor transporter transmembrane component T family protein n=1 Tax=Dolichospermum circinale TaxID=109265 RepID=UPI00232F24FE|nr:energy-coupling factor transporter transmembrane protein EcfT [Dolichospermum circinale]MDB9466902.1 energy-coupling factor transporter transmembrane protein EcfT [Dolichospermum circinale CS-539/09]MDB9472132.1 energy-coupling factor transporter transmembrane protein EcfT [Dolichospermum circinale CS-539]
MDLLRSLPIGLYLEEPQTWLHKLDPRVKLIWLLSFLSSYVFANNYWRVLLVLLLILFTVFAKIPLRVWRQQMGWLLVLSFMVLAIGAISPDGLGINYQSRLPGNEQILTQPSTDKKTQITPTIADNNKQYSYVLFHQGFVKVSHRSWDLAISLSTIVFTLIYSTNLYLLTTSPEEITSGMESLMQPLRRLNIPVTEITLTLTLSLRFIPLVLEEIQNLVRSVMTRAINWKKLGLKRGAKVWLIVTERLLKNLLLRAEQMANAMMVRGFTSPNEHQVKWQELKLKIADWLAIASLMVFWLIRIALGADVS